MSTVRPGDVLAGKYRVERVLGSGGMGYVVAARHLQLDQLVAMKFLRRDGTLDAVEATGRFLREAKAVVRLKDEHVAKVFDVDTLETGEPYIVMEYLEGCDLAALAKERGAIPSCEAVDYVLQACAGLAEAHSLGIVHRDVKLANLFVTRGHAGLPLVKVLDFGVSKVNPFGESEQEITRTASMLGSPRFMSPEQMHDPRAVDARTDLWSLGVVLYRLIAGKPPFQAETLGRLLSSVMHDTPAPLSSVCVDLALGLEEAVGRCLEKDPTRRYANAAELAYALVPFATDPGAARTAADRIAATLNVAQAPGVGAITVPTTSRTGTISSSPPGAHDATGAPWTGTQGGARRDGQRSGLVWASVALAATLCAGGLFAKIRHDHAQERAGAQVEPALTTSSGPGAESDFAATPPPVTHPQAPSVEPSRAAGPNDETATISLPPPATTAEPRPIRAAAPGAHKPSRLHAPPTTTPPPTGATKSRDGIPSTRD